MNRKGFADLVILAAIAIVGLTVWLTGPQIVKMASGGDKNQQKQVHKLNESYPVLYRASVDKNGIETYKVAGTAKKAEESLNLDLQKPPETLWEKFLHLGIIAVVVIGLIVGAIIFLGAGPLVMRWVNKLKSKIKDLEAKHEDLVYDATKIVVSVKAGLAVITPEDQAKFMAEMSKIQDQSTKDLVKELLKSV